MLATHGAASGVFLLANAAKYGSCEDLDTWVRSARGKSGFMAGAVDLIGCAQGIVRLGLATVSDVVRLHRELLILSERADRQTLIGISSLLFRNDPPPWISLAVRNGVVFREYIPSDDLRDLEWLEPHLNHLLIEAGERIARDRIEPLREALGRAGELAVLAAATDAGWDPLHVADLSDTYGYDIEIHAPSPQRLEVKSATVRSQDTFHLSRNEFNKCVQYGQEWRLIQVTFDSSIFTDRFVSASHILSIKEIASRTLQDLVPHDTATFEWSESAILRPPTRSWVPSKLSVPESFHLPSIRDLCGPSAAKSNWDNRFSRTY